MFSRGHFVQGGATTRRDNHKASKQSFFMSYPPSPIPPPPLNHPHTHTHVYSSVLEGAAPLTKSFIIASSLKIMTDRAIKSSSRALFSSVGPAAAKTNNFQQKRKVAKKTRKITLKVFRPRVVVFLAPRGKGKFFSKD